MKLYYLISLLLTIPFIGNASSLSISGNPKPLVVTKATAGNQPSSVLDLSTTYSIQVSPLHTATILASLDSPLNPHTSLKITLQVPSKAQSFSSTPLDINAKALVTNILEGSYNNLVISYEYLTTVKAGILPLNTKKILFTVLETTGSH